MSDADPRVVGLCADCRHRSWVTTPRSRFLFCERSRGDSSYERYPRLPVRVCPGHEPLEPPAGAMPEPPDEPPGAN